jgi:TolA-binding protein
MQERIEYLEGLRRIQSEQVEAREETIQSLRGAIQRLQQENTQQLHFLLLTTKRHEQLTAQYTVLQRRNQQLTGYTERLRDSIESRHPLMVWSDEEPTSLGDEKDEDKAG